VSIWIPDKYRKLKAMEEARRKPGTDMEEVIRREGQGWKQLTDEKTGELKNVWQFVHPKGYGFVTLVEGEYHWEANRGDRPPDRGKLRSLDDAKRKVTQLVAG